VKIVRAVTGVPIRLTPERFGHISRRHPEMISQEEGILETVETPDLIQEGDSGTLIALKLYQSTPLTEKYCAVIYREVSAIDGFVITAYFTTRPAAWRATIWTR